MTSLSGSQIDYIQNSHWEEFAPQAAHLIGGAASEYDPHYYARKDSLLLEASWAPDQNNQQGEYYRLTPEKRSNRIVTSLFNAAGIVIPVVSLQSAWGESLWQGTGPYITIQDSGKDFPDQFTIHSRANTGGIHYEQNPWETSFGYWSPFPRSSPLLIGVHAHNGVWSTDHELGIGGRIARTTINYNGAEKPLTISGSELDDLFTRLKPGEFPVFHPKNNMLPNDYNLMFSSWLPKVAGKLPEPLPEEAGLLLTTNALGIERLGEALRLAAEWADTALVNFRFP